MKYYKITEESECHYGLQYKTGINVDPLPFNPSGDCEPGGIYFASKDILAFLWIGPWIREVTLPEDEPVYTNLGSPVKYKAHRVILGKRRKITAKVIEQLIDEGANIHAQNDYALYWASLKGRTQTVKLLLDRGANIHAQDDLALCWASLKGRTKIVRLLLDRGANIHAQNDRAFCWAAEEGHTQTVRLLLGHGANIHAQNDYALRWAALCGHTETMLLLERAYEKRK